MKTALRDLVRETDRKRRGASGIVQNPAAREMFAGLVRRKSIIQTASPDMS